MNRPRRTGARGFHSVQNRVKGLVPANLHGHAASDDREAFLPGNKQLLSRRANTARIESARIPLRTEMLESVICTHE